LKKKKSTPQRGKRDEAAPAGGELIPLGRDGESAIHTRRKKENPRNGSALSSAGGKGVEDSKKPRRGARTANRGENEHRARDL